MGLCGKRHLGQWVKSLFDRFITFCKLDSTHLIQLSIINAAKLKEVQNENCWNMSDRVRAS